MQAGSQAHSREQLHLVAWVGNTSTSKGHSVSTTKTLCQYHHLESIDLPVFFFTKVFLCSKRLGTLPLKWQYHDVIDKATKATPVYPCPNRLDVKSGFTPQLCSFLPAKSDLQYQDTSSYRNSICFLVRFYSCSLSIYFL